MSTSLGTSHRAAESSRWGRLEHYARWKRYGGKCLLLTLPDELLSYIVLNFVGAEDVHSLMCALTGRSLTVSNIADVRAVHEQVRPRWLRQRIESAVTVMLQNISQYVLFDARHVRSVIAVADWSTFSGSEPLVLAEYAWCVAHPPLRSCPPYPSMRVYEPAVTAVIRRCIRKHMPVMRLACHCVIDDYDGQYRIAHIPLVWKSCTLYPHQLLTNR